MEEKAMIIQQLKNFSSEIGTYQYLQRREHLSPEDIKLITSLRFDALKGVGKFKPLITEITGKETVTFQPRNGRPPYSVDVWMTALKFDYDKRADDCISRCLDLITITVGRLEEDIKKGMRDKKTGLLKPVTTVELPPKAFISHGKASAALNKLKEFLETLGIEPLIVKKQPSLDKDLPDKVNLYLSQADFVIILATADDKVEDKLQPRQNVIHEIGLSQKTHPGKIIYLLEEGAEFPSNIRPKVWESFKQRNMMNAFLGIVRELRAYGMLKVTKYFIKEQV